MHTKLHWTPSFALQLEPSKVDIGRLNTELRCRNCRAVSVSQFAALQKLDRLRAWSEHDCKAVGLGKLETVQLWVARWRNQVSIYFELRCGEVADGLLLGGAGWFAGKVTLERNEYERLRKHPVWKLADAA